MRYCFYTEPLLRRPMWDLYVCILPILVSIILTPRKENWSCPEKIHQNDCTVLVNSLLPHYKTIDCVYRLSCITLPRLKLALVTFYNAIHNNIDVGESLFDIVDPSVIHSRGHHLWINKLLSDIHAQADHWESNSVAETSDDKLHRLSKGLRLFTQTVNVVNTETVRNPRHHCDHHAKPVQRQ